MFLNLKKVWYWYGTNILLLNLQCSTKNQVLEHFSAIEQIEKPMIYMNEC